VVEVVAVVEDRQIFMKFSLMEGKVLVDLLVLGVEEVL
jgi:hypothetical protein